MLAFVDESGDPGMKIESGSSKLFVVAVVTFNNRDEAQACDDRIANLRAELSIPRDFEFHFAHNSDRIKGAFLNAVAPFDFFYHVFALDKAKATGPGFQYQNSVYKWTARTTFENAKPYLEEAIVVLDKCGERKFRQELVAYLRKRINDGSGSRHIARLKTEASHKNNLLQLADYVVGVSAGTFQGNRTSAALHREFLASHETTRRLWPR